MTTESSVKGGIGFRRIYGTSSSSYYYMRNMEDMMENRMATERLRDMANRFAAKSQGERDALTQAWRSMPPDDRVVMLHSMYDDFSRYHNLGAYDPDTTDMYLGTDSMQQWNQMDPNTKASKVASARSTVSVNYWLLTVIMIIVAIIIVMIIIFMFSHGIDSAKLIGLAVCGIVGGSLWYMRSTSSSVLDAFDRSPLYIKK